MAPTQKLSDQLTYLKRKQALLETYSTLAAQEGYVLFEPEDFQSYDRFKRINARIAPQDMVKVTDTGGEVLILRPDVTSQVIDRLIPKWDGKNALKLYYDTTIFTHRENGIESKRQFGVENISNDYAEADKATLSLATRLLNESATDYMLELGNQRFLNALFDALDVSGEALDNLKNIITYKNAYEMKRFIERESLSPSQRTILTSLFELEGKLETIEKRLEQLPLDEAMTTAIDELRVLKTFLNGANVAYDLSMLSQFDYYEGIVFKAYIKDAPTAVLKGGRYAPGGTQASAIGFSIDIAPMLKGRDSNE